MDSTKKPMKAPLKPDDLSFGMVDLDEGGEEADQKPLTIDKLPAQKTARSAEPDIPSAQPAPKASGAPVASAPPPTRPAPDRQPHARPPSRYEPVTVSAPPLISPRTLKILLLVAVVLALLVGGAYGFLKWRERVSQQEVQERENIDSRSLDSLRDQAMRTDGLK